MKTDAIIAVAIGALITFVLGHDYGACQSVVVSALDPRQCSAATEYHVNGIALMIIGATWLLLGLARPAPR